ncbi:MAG TPA: hypothetical protein DC049_06655 [Spirochaetia bacterium]|nr:hypothetical protein [Spirochaetia bacterium]
MPGFCRTVKMIKNTAQRVLPLRSAFFRRFIKHTCRYISGCLLFYACSRNPLEITVPEITDISPSDSQTEVSPSVQVVILFSEEMNYQSAESAFTLSRQGNAVKGAFSWEENTLRFIPDEALLYGLKYFVEIKREALNKHGSRLTKNYLSCFTTGSAGNFPSVISVSPADGSVIDQIRPEISVKFSRAMNRPASETAFFFSPSSAGIFSWPADDCLVFRPQTDIPWLAECRILIKKNAGSLDGYNLEKEFSAGFRRGTKEDIPGLLGIYEQGNALLPVSQRYLAEEAENLSSVSSIVFHFNRDIDLASFENSLSFNPYTEGSSATAYDNEGFKIVFTPREKFPSALSLILSATCKDSRGTETGIDKRYYLVFNAPDSSPPELRVYDDNVLWSKTVCNTRPLAGLSLLTLHLEFSVPSAANMNQASIQGSSSILRFAGSGEAGCEGTITGISWTGGNDCLLKLGALGTNYYYRLTVRGGISGAADELGNYMSEDANYVFKTIP